MKFKQQGGHIKRVIGQTEAQTAALPLVLNRDTEDMESTFISPHHVMCCCVLYWRGKWIQKKVSNFRMQLCFTTKVQNIKYKYLYIYMWHKPRVPLFIDRKSSASLNPDVTRDLSKQICFSQSKLHLFVQTHAYEKCKILCVDFNKWFIKSKVWLRWLCLMCPYQGL